MLLLLFSGAGVAGPAIVAEADVIVLPAAAQTLLLRAEPRVILLPGEARTILLPRRRVP